MKRFTDSSLGVKPRSRHAEENKALVSIHDLGMELVFQFCVHNMNMLVHLEPNQTVLDLEQGRCDLIFCLCTILGNL